MKSLTAIATLSLTGAVVYSVFAPGEALPATPGLAAIELDPVSGQPREDDSEEAAPLQLAELAALAPLELLDSSDYADSVSPDIVLTGRVNPKSGAQPEVTVVAQSVCPSGAAGCEVQTYDTAADPVTGEFAIAVGPGTWRLVARAEGFLPATEDGLSLTPGEELGDIVMLLEKGERISGTVVHEGQPIEGTKVVAFTDDWVRTTLTDDLGHFAIEGLPPGTYTVQAYSGTMGGDEKRASAGSTVHLDLGHREKVRGKVVDARGMPVEGVAIYSDYDPIERTDSDPFPASGNGVFGLGTHGCGPFPGCYQRMTTGPDGRFEVDAAVGERIVVGARIGNRYALSTEVDPGSDVVLELREPLRLRVVDARRKPVPGAEVQIDPQPTFFGQPAPADAEGYVYMPDLGIESVTPPDDLYVEGEVPVKPWRINKEPLPELLVE